mgnify:CR=1 FL=1
MEFHSRFIRFVLLHERKKTKSKKRRERCFGQCFCSLCFGVFVDRKWYLYDDEKDELATKKIKRKRRKKCGQKCSCARGGDGER